MRCIKRIRRGIGATVPNIVPISAPLLFTANDCLDIGTDIGSPVSLDYFDKAPFKFNKKINQILVNYIEKQGESPAAVAPGETEN